jgi:hypothetical protein
LVVLRFRTYRWFSRNPLVRKPGRWLPKMTIELYDLSGHRMRAGDLPGMHWAWGRLAMDRQGRWVYAFNPGTGEDANVPTLVRYALP